MTVTTDFATMTGFDPTKSHDAVTPPNDLEDDENFLEDDEVILTSLDESESDGNNDDEEEGLGFSSSPFSSLGGAAGSPSDDDEAEDEAEPSTPSTDSSFNSKDAGFAPTEAPSEDDDDEDELAVGPGKSRPFPEQALPKVVLVGAGVLAIVCAVGAFLSVSGGSKAPQIAASVPVTAVDAAVSTDPANQSAAYKTEAALGDQSTMLRNQKLKAKGAVPGAQETPTSGSVTPTSAPAPESMPMPSSSVPSDSIVQPPMEQSPLMSAAPTSMNTPVVMPSPIDPVAQWQMLSKLGSYGQMSSKGMSYSPPTQSAAIPTYVPTYTPPTSVASSNALSQIRASSSTPGLRDRALTSVLVGSSTKGVLGTPILMGSDNSHLAPVSISCKNRDAITEILHQCQKPDFWHWCKISDNANSATKYLVKLTAPLNDVEGQVALPPDAILVVKARGLSSQTGSIDLEVVSVIVNNKEFKVPEGALGVRGVNGSALVANQNKTGGGLLSGIMPALFAGLAQAGQTINTPTSSSVTSTGGITSTSTNANNNISAAFLSGAFGSLSQKLTQQAQLASANQNQQPVTWTVPAGKEVQIFVNNTFEM